MTPAERFAAAPVARLATVGADGAPHLVPLVFAVAGETIHSAVDAKPKRHRGLKRLANIAAEPRVSLLVDHYADDWTTLWWVRADGLAVVRETSAAGLAALAGKYEQYRVTPPPGPFIEIVVRRWTAWSA
ncbi:TIGR03668 family PPOX class F420-dependent oxidoreductase [Actinoplanes sp. NPDC051470]|uniref:TIGR03668 family PPOX class F420-dependent oxidoreductase n=1 Tax=Actinoplanes sp. NPDC051470 TaxID=3157224 RepID=UPI00343F1916